MGKRGAPIQFFCPDGEAFRLLVEKPTYLMELARHYNVPPTTIKRWSREQGVSIPVRAKLPPKWGKRTGSIYTSQGRAWQAMNTPEKIAALLTPERVEAFWAKAKKLGADQCWLWTGTISPSRGYGATHLPGGFNMAAHRVAWMIRNGVIPADMHVLHECDVRICVNPAHLKLGTNADNMADRDSKLRMPHGERCGAVKLTPDQVRAIRAAAGTNKEIGERFGVHHAHVSKIRLRQKWQHLAD
jgi:hypothetical protein